MERMVSNSLAMFARVRSGDWQCEQFGKGGFELVDHVLGEGGEEYGACFHVSDDGFPQLFKLVEGCKGKLELLGVFARGQKLWGLQVLAEVAANAVTGLDVVENDSW